MATNTLGMVMEALMRPRFTQAIALHGDPALEEAAKVFGRTGGYEDPMKALVLADWLEEAGSKYSPVVRKIPNMPKEMVDADVDTLSDVMSLSQLPPGGVAARPMDILAPTPISESGLVTEIATRGMDPQDAGLFNWGNSYLVNQDRPLPATTVGEFAEPARLSEYLEKYGPPMPYASATIPDTVQEFIDLWAHAPRPLDSMDTIDQRIWNDRHNYVKRLPTTAIPTAYGQW